MVPKCWVVSIILAPKPSRPQPRSTVYCYYNYKQCKFTLKMCERHYDIFTETSYSCSIEVIYTVALQQSQLQWTQWRHCTRTMGLVIGTLTIWLYLFLPQWLQLKWQCHGQILPHKSKAKVIDSFLKGKFPATVFTLILTVSFLKERKVSNKREFTSKNRLWLAYGTLYISIWLLDGCTWIYICWVAWLVWH